MTDPRRRTTPGPESRNERPSARRRATMGIESLEGRVLLSYGAAGPGPRLAYTVALADATDRPVEFPKFDAATTSEGLYTIKPPDDPGSTIVRLGDPDRLERAASFAQAFTGDEGQGPRPLLALAPGGLGDPDREPMPWAILAAHEYTFSAGIMADSRPAQPLSDASFINFNLGAVLDEVPVVPHAVVKGALAADSAQAVFTVPVRAVDGPDVSIDVHFPRFDGPMPPSRVVVYRGDGGVIGQYAMPKPGDDLVLKLHANTAIDDTLIVGIARESSDAIAAPAPVISFSITVDRGDRLTPGQESSGLSRNAEGMMVRSLQWSTAPGFAIDDPADDSPGSMAPLTLGQESMGTLLLPLRSAGIPGDPRVAPPVDRLDGAVVDLSLLDLSPDLEMTASEETSPRPTLTADGFPLLGSSRSFSTFDTGAEISLIADASGSADLNEPIVPPMIEEPKRPPLGWGLGALAAVTAGLVVPDVVARFAPESARRPSSLEGQPGRKRSKEFFGPNGSLGA